MKHWLKKLLLALSLLAFCSAPYAVFDPVNDDTDLFRNNPNIPSERPNVLIILDNTANWSSGGKFSAEKIALVSVVGGLDSSFNVGMMIFTQGGQCTTANVNGGYVRFGIRQMTSANKTGLTTVVNSFADASCNNVLTGGDQGSSAAGAQAMHEAYLYFAGLTSRSGITQERRDYTGNPNNTTAGNLSGNPLSSSSATIYTSPITDACQKNYIIFISNGPFDNGDDSPSSLLYAGASGLVPGATTIALNPSGSQSNWSDEYAYYLAHIGVNRLGGNQTVSTYAVEVDPTTTGQGPGHTALLKSMANQGNGKYFGVTSANSGSAIVDALNSIFTEIQAVNSVFAASTLPVSVNVRGTNLNQLYIGVFRPDAKDQPRWLGNLKAYQLKKDSSTGAVFTVDKNLVAAINPTTGFITSTAVSFWTDPALPSANYWSFRTASVNGVGGNSDSPDGDLVEKGGAAQQIRALYFAAGVNGVTPDPYRPLYTCTQGPAYPVCNTNPGGGTLSLLSATPFADANTDIDAGSLSINTKPVTPLTAAQTKPVTLIKDRRTAVLNNTGTNVFDVYGDLIKTNTDFACYFTLDNTRTVSVTAISNGAVSQTASFSKQGTKNRGTLANHGLSVGQTIIVTGTTSFNTTGTTITAATSSTFDYGTFGGSGNPTESGTVTTSNTTVNVTAASHGFTTGQSVTIAGASPSSFNGTKTITVIDSSHFSYPNTVSTAPSGTITASAPSTLVKATLTSPSCGATLSFVGGDAITVVNGSGTDSYTISATVLSSPAPTTTTFYYSTPSAITAAPMNAFYYTQRSGTNASAVIYDDPLIAGAPFGFTNGASVTLNITGAAQAGFNGQHTGTVYNLATDPNACASPPVQPYWCSCGSCGDWWAFQYTVPAGTGFSASRSDPATAIRASSDTSTTVTVTLTNHGFSTGDMITLSGVTTSGWNGNWGPITVVDANTFTFSTSPTALPSPSGTPQIMLTTNPRAYVTFSGISDPGAWIANAFYSVGTYTRPSTVNGFRFRATSSVTPFITGTTEPTWPTTAGATVTDNGITWTAEAWGHGYGATGTVVNPITISGAVPSGYNGTFTTGRVEDADTVSYVLSSAPGTYDASSTTTATTNSTTALATATAHGLSPGSVVTISGASPSQFNGAVTVLTTPTADTFT